QCMTVDIRFKSFELIGGRKFAKNQQVRNFKERSSVSQILDGISAVTQDTLFPIKESDVTFTNTGIFVARIICDGASGRTQFFYINGNFVLAANNYRELVLIAVEFYCCCFGHKDLGNLLVQIIFNKTTQFARK